ncbi:cytochrome P450 [Streptacidiphilus sp. MAP5-3]|uniref:cytochrome P450 n=1 Tax=unclassified Streptacidiphilus TaxID=2643834 RepID=UPI003511F4E4
MSHEENHDGNQGGNQGVNHDGSATVDLNRVNLFDPRFHATGDPHRVWAAMRERAPLHRQELPDGRSFWSVTRYHDVCRVLGEHREFTSERGSLLHQLGTNDAASGLLLVATDPPRHTELRRPLNRMFSATGLAATRERIRAAVRGILAPALDVGEWDLAECAAKLPMAVAAQVMDIPEEYWPDLVAWSAMAASPEDPAHAVPDGSALLVAHHGLFDYFSREFDRRSGTPGDDAIRLLMTMRGGELSREEVVVNCYSLLLGANATTPHTVTGTLLALAERPWLYRRAAAEPAAIPGLVEEGLRWSSAASCFLRHAVDDVEIAGGVVPAGDPVAVWIGSANRDATVFRDPELFDPTRGDNRHIAFGFGPHYCLGATMARITLRIFFEEFLGLFEEIEPAGEPVRLASNFVSGYTRVPLRTRVRRSLARRADEPIEATC